MSKKFDPQSKQAKREKKMKQENQDKKTLELLNSLASLRDDVELALIDIHEDWPLERIRRLDEDKQEKVIPALTMLLAAFQEIETALEAINEDAPKSVQEAFEADQKVEEGFPDVDIQFLAEHLPAELIKAQSKMQDNIVKVLEVPHPAVAACNAACGAAETMYLAGVSLVERTRAAALEVADSFDQPHMRELKELLTSEAESSYAFAADCFRDVYRDTCLEAAQSCKIVVEGVDAIRQGQTIQ